MSYDVDFMVIVDGKETFIGNFNHTSNTGQMMEDAMGIYIGDIDDMKAEDALPYFEQGRKELKTNPEKYRHLEASNGWGTVDTTLKFITCLHKQAQITPHAIIKVFK